MHEMPPGSHLGAVSPECQAYRSCGEKFSRATACRVPCCSSVSKTQLLTGYLIASPKATSRQQPRCPSDPQAAACC
eukprot:7583485-Pyramimonas_sp.AAC.1